ncbi:branched-chain amino acid ABC transporter permease [Nocardioides sp. GCM10027113]|uniref:branched-chain amino acid ABC transporter permease n=1 Tax=unclassified Nocardioides TaxID=2615069 RepID=UPI00361D6B1E
MAGLLFAVLLAPLLLLIGTSTAHASALCLPDDGTSCIVGTLRSEEGPVAEVNLVITTPAGEEVTVTTDEAGKWNYPATEAGEYVVTLDEESFPEGLAAQGVTERTLDVKIGKAQKTFPALFNVRTAEFDATTSRSDLLIQSSFNGLRLGLLLALASVGLSLIYGTTGLSNFAHAEQVTLGGILAYGFVNVAGLNLWVGMVIVVALCGLTGYLQDRGMWQPLRRRGLGLTQMMIVTIGMSLAAQYTFQYFVGASTVKVVVQNFDTTTFGPITVTNMSFVAMGISVVVIAAVGYILLRTRIGRATRAVSDNPALAAASGIDVDRIIRLVWTAAAGLAGLAGVLYALVVSNGIRWDTGMQILLLLFAAVTLGGLGTAFGALVGSLIIGMVVELAGPLGAPGDLKYAVALGILILLLLVRPQGLLGRAERVG